MLLSRAQLLAIANEVDSDPTIEQLDIDVDAGGKLRVSAVEIKPVLRPIRLTKKKVNTTNA